MGEYSKRDRVKTIGNAIWWIFAR